MDRDQVKEVFKVLSFAYPKFEVSKDKVDFWHKYLADQNPAAVMRKAEWYIKNSVFPPAIADLREARRREDPSVLAQFWSRNDE
jgi:hypothetical protein